MTDLELKTYGWTPQVCKIGTLYFRDNFFCRFINDDTVTVLSVKDDMYPLGRAKTIEELDNIQKEYDRKQLEGHKRKYEEMLHFYKSKYNEDFE